MLHKPSDQKIVVCSAAGDQDLSVHNAVADQRPDHLGVRRVLPSIPGILGATLLAFLVAPHVALLAAAKVLSKVLDYSLFRATKELLYIPLTYAEKTQGKAVIDMLTYRVAKGGASLLLLAVVALDTPRVVGWLTLGVIATWVFVSVGLARRYTGESA